MIYEKYARFVGHPSGKVYSLLSIFHSVSYEKGVINTKPTTCHLLDVDGESLRELSYEDFKKSIDLGNLVRVTK